MCRLSETCAPVEDGCYSSVQCGVIGQYGCYCERTIEGSTVCKNNFLVGRTNIPTREDGQCWNSAECKAHFGDGFVCVDTCYGYRCAPPCGNTSY